MFNRWARLGRSRIPRQAHTPDLAHTRRGLLPILLPPNPHSFPGARHQRTGGVAARGVVGKNCWFLTNYQCSLGPPSVTVSPAPVDGAVSAFACADTGALASASAFAIRVLAPPIATPRRRTHTLPFDFSSLPPPPPPPEDASSCCVLHHAVSSRRRRVPRVGNTWWTTPRLRRSTIRSARGSMSIASTPAVPWSVPLPAAPVWRPSYCGVKTRSSPPCVGGARK